EKGEPAKPAEKTISFEFRDKPWGSVLEWLRDVSNLPIISPYKPTGSFTFIPPKGKSYTLPEVVDILNEGLVSQKYVLIRREQSFTLVPADEKIDPALLPRVTVAELNDHGKTEMVSVVVPLASLNADEFKDEAKKMMGPFGEVVPLTQANKLLLQDTVGNI